MELKSSIEDLELIKKSSFKFKKRKSAETRIDGRGQSMKFEYEYQGLEFLNQFIKAH